MRKKITFDRVFRWLMGAALIWIILYLMGRFSTLVIFFVISLVFMYLLDPVVNRLESRGMHRLWSVSIVVVGLIGGLVWVSTYLIPAIGTQLISFTSTFNAESIRLIVRQVVDAFVPKDLPLLNPGEIESYLLSIVDEYFVADAVTDKVAGVFGVFANIFTAVLIIPVCTFFLLKDGFVLRRRMLKVVPNAYFETTLVILDKIESRLILYFSSILLQSTIVGFLSFVFLSLVGLESALLVGVTMGLANSIPYFGPIIGYALSVVVPIYEVGTVELVPNSLLAVLVVQVIDNVFLQPVIFSKSADLHPVYILFAVLVGAEVAGVIGMLLAIPVTTILRITITEIHWSFQQYHVFKSE